VLEDEFLLILGGRGFLIPSLNSTLLK